jgi:hypothetical protein
LGGEPGTHTDNPVAKKKKTEQEVQDEEAPTTGSDFSTSQGRIGRLPARFKN